MTDALTTLARTAVSALVVLVVGAEMVIRGGTR